MEQVRDAFWNPGHRLDRMRCDVDRRVDLGGDPVRHAAGRDLDRRSLREFGQRGNLADTHRERQWSVGIEPAEAAVEHESMHQAITTNRVDDPVVRPRRHPCRQQVARRLLGRRLEIIGHRGSWRRNRTDSHGDNRCAGAALQQRTQPGRVCFVHISLPETAHHTPRQQSAGPR